MEIEDPNIEMIDIGSENYFLSPVDHYENPAPEQPTVTDCHSADRWGSLSNLSEAIPYHLPSPILVGSDTDTDLSDDDGYNDNDNNDHDDDHNHIHDNKNNDNNDHNHNDDHNHYHNDDHNHYYHNNNNDNMHQLGQDSVTLPSKLFSFEWEVIYTDYDYQLTRVLQIKNQRADLLLLNLVEGLEKWWG